MMAHRHRASGGIAQEQDCLQYCFQVIISNSPGTGWSYNTDGKYPKFSSANLDWHLVFWPQSYVGGFGL